MNITIDNPSSSVFFPILPLLYPWKPETIKWAIERGMTQTEVDRIEENLDSFRAKRDFFQWQRREQVLSQLNERKTALKREIDTLRMEAENMGIQQTKNLAWVEFQAALAHNHKRDALLSKAVELGWEYQQVSAQVAVIESEHEALTARVPAQWKAFYGNIIVDSGELRKAAGE